VIAIIDYGSGNTAAIANIFKQLKVPHCITSDHAELERADRYILPGVGAFDATMAHLAASGTIAVLNEQVIGRGKKVMGICVGMQIFAESSEEGELPGLGWIPGRVRRIDPSRLTSAPRLPHMGWNSIEVQGAPELFDGVDLDRGFYFLHNYYFDAADPSDVIATVDYGGRFPCGVAKGNVIGLQFHAEKGHASGVAVFRNFAGL